MHELRAASDAVAVGMGTVRADAPRLDARDVGAVRQPRRLAFGRGPLPEGSELELRTGPLGGRAARARGRGRPVAAARGRPDARDCVPDGGPRRQASSLRRPVLGGPRAALGARRPRAAPLDLRSARLLLAPAPEPWGRRTCSCCEASPARAVTFACMFTGIVRELGTVAAAVASTLRGLVAPVASRARTRGRHRLVRGRTTACRRRRGVGDSVAIDGAA